MFDPSTVAAIVLKTSLLVVAIGLIALLTARQSAARRHFLWTSALVLSLLMPIAVVYLPSWVQVSLPWEAAEPWSRDESALVTVGARHADRRVGSSASRDRTSPRPLGAPDADGMADRNDRLARRCIGRVASQRAGACRTDALGASSHGLIFRRRGLQRCVGWQAKRDFADPCACSSPTTRRVPAPSDSLRPVVLLPAAGADWPEPQRRFTLLHELAHVRRLDYLTTQIASMACAVHWYNPLVWFAAGQARKLQEQACDDVVLNAGGTPSDYAQFLVGLAGVSRRLSPAFPAAVGMVQRSQLHGRVTAILDASRARLPLGGLALVTALAPLAGLMFFLATLSVAATPLAMQPGVPLTASFSSVELRNGGKVNLIHGQSQGVTLLKGDPEQASITIRDDGRLVIDRCPTHCPRNHDFEVEVVTPALSAIAVAEGGTIQSPRRLPASVRNRRRRQPGRHDRYPLHAGRECHGFGV